MSSCSYSRVATWFLSDIVSLWELIGNVKYFQILIPYGETNIPLFSLINVFVNISSNISSGYNNAVWNMC